MRPRFRFRIANLLLATFWTVVWFGAYAALKHTIYLELELGPDTQWPKRQALVSALAVIPFSAIGALFGHSWRASVAGASLVFAAATIDWLFLPQVID